MLFLNWFASRTVRQAWQAAKHVEKILHHQSDLLSAEAVAAVKQDIEHLRSTCRAGEKKIIIEALAKIEKTANKWLKSYPHAAWRENIEVALVAIAVAMGIRTFFLQPFKIPTGSMQPTLYGVTQEDLRGQPVQIPNGLSRFCEYWFNGVQYFHIVAKSSGTLSWDEPTKAVLFNLKQTYRIDGVVQGTIWFPPDELFGRGGTYQGAPVTAGSDIIKLRVISGDHLFVDRITFNFRHPGRGDIVVFETHGITRLRRDQQDTYYIKRLCGLGGETLKLSPDYDVAIGPSPDAPKIPVGHLVVNGEKSITASTPHFENVYSYPDAVARNRILPLRENHYYGHAMIEAFAPGGQVQVSPNHYFVMGDNTFNSSDSRYWGEFPESKVIGKSFFVYWPIGGTPYKGEQRPSRFGWAHR